VSAAAPLCRSVIVDRVIMVLIDLDLERDRSDRVVGLGREGWSSAVSEV
jgi:hypothetical protein